MSKSEIFFARKKNYCGSWYPSRVPMAPGLEDRVEPMKSSLLLRLAERYLTDSHQAKPTRCVSVSCGQPSTESGPAAARTAVPVCGRRPGSWWSGWHCGTQCQSPWTRIGRLRQNRVHVTGTSRGPLPERPGPGQRANLNAARRAGSGAAARPPSPPAPRPAVTVSGRYRDAAPGPWAARRCALSPSQTTRS